VEAAIKDIKRSWLSLRRSQRLSLLEEYEYVRRSAAGDLYANMTPSCKKKYRDLVIKNDEISEVFCWSSIIDLKNHDEEFFLRSIR
jgi:hypothetical protein